MGAAHHTRNYRKARTATLTQAQATNTPCALADTFPDTCPGWIDYTLTYPHPWCATTEHLIPAHQGGDHTTLDVAHLHCQQRQGGLIATGLQWDAIPPIKRSGIW